MYETRFHARQAAPALLKMAKTTSDPRVAAGLIEAAVDLKDQAGELPPPRKYRQTCSLTKAETKLRAEAWNNAGAKGIDPIRDTTSAPTEVAEKKQSEQIELAAA